MEPEDSIIEKELMAQPISKTQMDLLWLDPAALDRLEQSLSGHREELHMISNNEGGLKELKATIEEIKWAKEVNYLAGKAAAASQKGDYSVAISLYRKALNLAPGCDQWFNSIGSCYALMGEWQKGLKYLNRALEVSSQPRRIEENLARLKNLLGQKQESQSRPEPANVEEAIRRIYEVGGKNAWVFVWLFHDLESTLVVHEKLPYRIHRIIQSRIEPRPGVQSWIIHMPNYVHSDGKRGVYALVTGGYISVSEASIVMDLAKSAGSLPGSAVMKPNEFVERVEWQ